ncbi:MAG: 16S rRNA (guanine(527)-N(7))-methyltransferase RsmG [Candidatus Zhuqueibacterota bacterium]
MKQTKSTKIVDKLSLLKIASAKTGLDWSLEADSRFVKFIKLIHEWNARTNLVSRLDESHLIDRHIMESIAVLSAVDIASGSKVVDVGSGGGFPALPVAFMREDITFVLVESKRLKSLFLKEVVLALALKNVQVINERIEQLDKLKQWNSFFNFCFSRAVADVDIVYDWIKNILTQDGLYIAWKGGDVQNEIDTFHKRYPEIFLKRIEMDERFVDKEKKRCFIVVLKK